MNVKDVHDWWYKKRADIPDDDAIAFLFGEIETLRQQRDELVEAMKSLGYCNGGLEGVDPCPACEDNERIVDKLLTKIKEG